VTIAALPAVAAVAVAVGMARSRLFTCIQLLPGLLTDPFGAGWDPFEWSHIRVDVPLEPVRLIAVQATVLVAGAAAGAIDTARRDPDRRDPGAVSATIVAGAGRSSWPWPRD
jgi:hypothetical protein